MLAGLHPGVYLDLLIKNQITIKYQFDFVKYFLFLSLSSTNLLNKQINF